MPDRLDPCDTFEAHRAWLRKVAEITCRRNSVWGDDAEDFAAVAMMKVIENDYAVLRQFEGRAELRSYLATVVVRRFYEWARERWGRWRHSARAEQLGPVAKHLEALVYRDGCSLREAIEVLRSRGGLAQSDGELARMFAQLPVRPHHGRASPALMEELPADDAADGEVLDAERDGRCREVMEVLFRALSRLEPEDQVLVRGRYAEGRSVADIARALSREQMPLYRRSERLRNELRAFMEGSGVRQDDVRECLGLDET
jgi:RNA polymerase sigma factor (sigma-70 family)